MSVTNRWARISALGLAMACCAPGALITYYFSGTSVAGSPTSNAIPAGTSFTGSVTFDPATPNTGAGDSLHRNFDNPLHTFQFAIGSGLYDFTSTSVGIEVDHNIGSNFGGGDVFWFYSNAQTITGTAQGPHPLLVGVDITVLLWRQNSNGIFSTANTMDAAPLLNLGLWDFAGIDLTTQNGEHYLLAFSTISTEPPNGSEIPEPGTIGLMGMGLVAAGWARKRQRP